VGNPAIFPPRHHFMEKYRIFAVDLTILTSRINQNDEDHILLDPLVCSIGFAAVA